MSRIKIPFEGVRVGHFTDIEGGTGVTAIIFENNARGVLAYRGSAASTRQFDSLLLGHSVRQINALCFTGGSAMGLSAGGGVQKFLRERKKGLLIRNRIHVPIVPTAAIFDLFYKSDSIPGEEAGYIAAQNASREFSTGSVGAGTGATVGKIPDYSVATKGGLGAALGRIGDINILVLAVVNNFGNVIDRSGNIIAGIRGDSGFVDLKSMDITLSPFENTNLFAVITDAGLDREDLLMAGRVVSAVFGRHFSPPGSSADGDILVMVSAGDKKIQADILGFTALEVAGAAVEDAIYSAEGTDSIPSVSQLKGG